MLKLIKKSFDMRRAKLQQHYPTFYTCRTFCGSWGFIFMSRKFHHLSICRARGILTVPTKHISWRYILVLFSHPFIGLAGDLCPSDFSTNMLPCMPFSSLTCSTCPAHLILLDLITWVIISGEYNSWNFSSCIFIQCPVISFFIGQNIFFSILFCNTLSSVWEIQFHTHINNRQNHSYVFFILLVFGYQTRRKTKNFYAIKIWNFANWFVIITSP